MVEFHFYSHIDDYLSACIDSDSYLDSCNNGDDVRFIPDYDTTDSGFQLVIDDLITIQWENYNPPNRIIHTLQMSFLTRAWDLHFEYGARVFIHDHTGTYEVLEGDKCERTDRYLRRAHNLFKLWKSGEFWGSEKEKETWEKTIS